MKWTENQKVIAEVICKHRRGNGYDLNACLKELPHTSRGTISKVYTKLKASNWAISSEASNSKEDKRVQQMSQQVSVETKSVGYAVNSPGKIGIVPLGPDFPRIVKDILVCFWCAIQFGHRGEFLSWIRDVVWDYWQNRGVDPYKILESANMPTAHIEECAKANIK
jgi:hypothetical protein